MNVDSPEFLANPYVFYEQRRRLNPAFKRNATTWTMTGYDVLSKTLAHSDIGRGNIGQTPRPEGDLSELLEIRDDNLALQIMDQWMLFQNPPEHTANRKFVADVFTIKMVEQLESLMRQTMRDLISDLKSTHTSGSPFDLIKSIAYPYPANVICEMIGIPSQDQQKFAQWTKTFSLSVQVDFIQVSNSSRAELNQAAKEVSAYFDRLIAKKKGQQSNDLITRLIHQSDGSTDHMQLLSSCVFLLFAGLETTTSLISNTIYALLTNPDQLALLRSDTSLMKNAVDECLRFDPAIQMIGRFALKDVEFPDLTINKGDHIFAFIGAAGRDPNANANPNKFDISRKKINHLAFARGAHYCLGANLAKLEIQVMLEEFLAAFPHLQLSGEAIRRPTWLMRGFSYLPLTYQEQSLHQTDSNNPQIKIDVPSSLYNFDINDLTNIVYGDYQLTNVFGTATDDQRHAIVDMWMRHKVLPSKQHAWQRSKEVCYLITERESGDVVGVNTLYLDKLEHRAEEYYFNRMYILPEHRVSRLMVVGTAAMLCFAKLHLSNQGVAGVVNVNENTKLNRTGSRRIFDRLGYRHYGWDNNKEVILFEFKNIQFVTAN